MVGSKKMGKEAAQDRGTHEHSSRQSRGNRGAEGAARRCRCGAKGCEQRDGGQEWVGSWGQEASSQGEGFRAGSAVLSRTGMGEV